MYKIKNLARLIDADEIMELLHKCLNSKHKKISLLTKGDKPNILSVKHNLFTKGKFGLPNSKENGKNKDV